MRSNLFKSGLIKSGLAASILLLAGGAAFAQTVNLTAGPSTAPLPDGSAAPMWGYSCGAVVATGGATCAALNPTAGAAWSPVVITVPVNTMGPTNLTINLTNNLTFAGGAVPTSLTIVGQLGGGLGISCHRRSHFSSLPKPKVPAPHPHAFGSGRPLAYWRNGLARYRL